MDPADDEETDRLTINCFLAGLRLQHHWVENGDEQAKVGRDPYPPTAMGIARRVNAQKRYDTALQLENRLHRATEREYEYYAAMPRRTGQELMENPEHQRKCDPSFSEATLLSMADSDLGTEYARAWVNSRRERIPDGGNRRMAWYTGELQKRKNEEATLMQSVPQHTTLPTY